jgi:plasmid stabilization system protein ParE
VAEYRLARDARADLQRAFRYSVREFGVKRAVAYAQAIRSACTSLGDVPNPGTRTRLPGRKRDVWWLRVGEHVLFYRVDRRGALVFKILHRSQLPALHL